MGGEIPEKRLLRRGEAIRWLGISKQEFTKLIRAEVIKPRKFREEGKAYYLRDELLKLLEAA
jgi:hypothetical protein